METSKTIAETGVVWPTIEALTQRKLTACPKRGAVRNPAGKASARCNIVIERHGKPHSVSLGLCKICQANGEPNFLNPFLKSLVCHLAWNDVIAGANAVAPLSPTDADIDVAISIVREYRGDEIAHNFIDSLFYNESISAEKAIELIHAFTAPESP